MKRIVLPDNLTDDYLKQNLGKTTCSKCGARKIVNRPYKQIRELRDNAGIHNFTFKGEDGHTSNLYWDYNNFDELPIRIHATPNLPELRDSEDTGENFIAFQVSVKSQPVISNYTVNIDGELTVEKYLKAVRNFIEQKLVWTYNSDGDLVEGGQ